ncbi:hypothetical protein OVA24_08355 [Luteolibacter sp. SL250]|uniref:hypothetical protein n=1 Tax=Luteolibacter sp. SL250 TaxID=2995170 RepID=UPI00226D72A5|nr:hypothetical protein [Luteolibacter sp. SL250]WAC21397.1 hypothetical protein OVA24_08355 [Luteolibacter sp. SL250]
MNEGNIYQAPTESGPSFAPQPIPVHKPAILQVFGILHLLAAGYGLITGLWGIFMAVAGNPFINMVPPGPARDAQENMTRAIQPMMNINLGITAVLVVLVTIAGIKLLRAKKDAVKASNRYAIASLLGKIAGGVLVFIYMVPAQRQMMEDQLGQMGDLPAGMKTGMDAAMIGGAIGSILFTCLYPILTLILLNRRSVKGWLEQFGK